MLITREKAIKFDERFCSWRENAARLMLELNEKQS